MVRTDVSTALDRSRYEVEVDDRFETDELDRRLWLPWYLPHWSSRERSAARYRVGGGTLRLRIDADQQPWSQEFDGDVVVSSLQTGEFCGPLGSAVGQLRFRDGVVVREAQRNVALYTPTYGLFELRARAIADAANMVALWMIGYEDEPTRSGEICICEIFGRDVGASSARVGMGIHPWADPALRDEFAAEAIAIDATQSHVYAAEWTPEHVAFYVDDTLVKVVGQSPSYPMQFMLNIYEFRDDRDLPSPPEAYAKMFVVERFTGYRPVRGPGARAPAFSARSRSDSVA